MKVYNEDVWEKYVKTGRVKGFSIEGYFADKVNMGTQVEDEEAKAEKLLEEIRKELETLKSVSKNETK